MRVPTLRIALASLVCCGLLAIAGAAAATPADTDRSGVIALRVDATDLAHGVFRMRERVPVRPGALTLLYPKWLPGRHAPDGPIAHFAGLTISANGRTLAWTRDPLDVYRFDVEIPAGVSEIEIVAEALWPSDGEMGLMTPAMLTLQWNMLLLYPAGAAADRILVAPELTVPPGWQAFTALDVAARDGDVVRYRTTDLDTLVDSPVYAGRHARVFDLAPGAKTPVRLNVVADEAAWLDAAPAHLDRLRALVRQARRLFGTQPFDRYDFLLSLSAQLYPSGIEHQRSSENGLDADYFTGWTPQTDTRDLLAHEYVHAWNGKFRRPAGLATPNFDVPMTGDLLWVYEGLTQYWGQVLLTRAGLQRPEAARDALAQVAAAYAANRPGLRWRNVQDSTRDPLMPRDMPAAYPGWQLGFDYYRAGALIWLEADARIRAKTGGRRSLDDFARAFFAGEDGRRSATRPYGFDDVVAALNAVSSDDWATFLRTRVDGRAPPIAGLEAGGWRLVFEDAPAPGARAAMKGLISGDDFIYSLGFAVGPTKTFTDVRWDSPAFDAGIGRGMTLVAVDDREYSRERLEDAVRAATAGARPIRLTVKHYDRYRTVDIDYHGGLRYPHLRRIDARPDLLARILAPRE